MKNIVRTFFAAALLLSGLHVYAQPQAGDNQRLTPQVMARLFPAGVVSPEYNADGSVTFRCQAPQAQKVSLDCQMLPAETPMTKGENGVWSITVTPGKPDIYPYAFVVDGTKIADPNNMLIFPNEGFKYSLADVRGAEPSVQDIQNVPHGKVSYRFYHSETCGIDRVMTVYTPAGYDPAGSEKLPVLYLIHGMTDTYETWFKVGHMNNILDNLIAQGKAQPMIVVMPNGHAGMSAAPGESDMGYYKPYHFEKGTMDGTFETYFPEIVKFVDKTFRTQADKAHRAIAGLSMGGFHSAFISANYPDLFGYVGLFSAAVGVTREDISPIYKDFDAKLATQFKKGVKLYWMGCGNVDFLYKNNKALREKFDAAGYPYVYLETDGGHVWKNWRIYLADYAPRLFK